MEFCYNSTKCSTIGASLFKLTLRVEEGQPMDLAIPRFRRVCHEGGKKKETVKKTHKKLLEKSHTSYEKQVNKI